MQLIPRYLLKNKITIVMNDAGFVTEFMPVYSRQIKIYKGIDNTIQFHLLNADQKPVDITNLTPIFVAFDSQLQKILQYEGNILDSVKGKFTISILENDIINVDKQYLRYNIYLQAEDTSKEITFVNSNFDNNGTIFIDDYAFPGPAESKVIDLFTEQDSEWVSASVSAQPEINGNSALHTAAIYNNNYVGTISLQATLQTTIGPSTDWVDIDEYVFDGTEQEPLAFNFYGVYSYIRFKSNTDPVNISKILIRN